MTPLLRKSNGVFIDLDESERHDRCDSNRLDVTGGASGYQLFARGSSNYHAVVTWPADWWDHADDRWWIWLDGGYSSSACLLYTSPSQRD